MVIVLLAIFITRRRKRKNGVISMQPDDDPDKKVEKAQLHADSIALPRHELEGAKAQEPAELPALEPVGSELTAKNRDSNDRGNG